MSRLVLQSRTGVGTNCKSAFPGARTQGGIRATDLSRLSFNIPSFSPIKTQARSRFGTPTLAGCLKITVIAAIAASLSVPPEYPKRKDRLRTPATACLLLLMLRHGLGG